MTEAARLLTLQFLAWLEERPRSRADVIATWRSSCPRLAIWEDALADGLVSVEDGGAHICASEAGRARLAEARGRRSDASPVSAAQLER